MVMEASRVCLHITIFIHTNTIHPPIRRHNPPTTTHPSTTIRHHPPTITTPSTAITHHPPSPTYHQPIHHHHPPSPTYHQPIHRHHPSPAITHLPPPIHPPPSPTIRHHQLPTFGKISPLVIGRRGISRLGHLKMEQAFPDMDLEGSPDVQILADDDFHSESDHGGHSDRDDDDDALTIKPPQQHGSKKDRHKHKHKDPHKRERYREEKVAKRGHEKPATKPERRVARPAPVPPLDPEMEARRREKSLRERERLEKLERERHRLERERARREQQHRDRMRRADREKERQRATQREQRKAEARRHQAQQQRPPAGGHPEKSYPKQDSHHHRSRSPAHKRRDDKAGRREREKERARVRQDSLQDSDDRALHEEFEEAMQEGPMEPRPHPPSSAPASPDRSPSEVSATDTEESGGGDTESDSGASSGDFEAGSDRRQEGGRSPEQRRRSKFEQSDNEEAQGSFGPSDNEHDYIEDSPEPSPLVYAPDLPPYYPAIQGCRNVEEFNCLNRIEEGTYGVVFRALDKKTKEIVALKKLKMEKEKEGFPITSLREINTLLKSQHRNIVTVREIVVGSNMDKIYIVMDYVEHDLKSLMETMKDRFVIGEVKTLIIQLLKGVAHLHDNWIIHRDLKTSNLLLSHKGILKIGDFGLAREYGSPLKQYTPIVVTLWYRAPELLLGTKEYSTAIDMWSVGCIFAEFLTSKPLFPGKSDIDQLNRIFKELGTPNEKIWPGVKELPAMKKCTFADFPYNQLRNRFGSTLTDKGFDLLNRFLTYNPERRISAEEGLKHDYYNEAPLPIDPSFFPTWPAKSEQPRRAASPKPPSGGKAFSKLLGDDDSIGFHLRGATKGAPDFALKFHQNSIQ